MRPFLLLITCLLCASVLTAQDSVRQPRRSFDSSLFSENNALTRSDYLGSLDKAFDAFNRAPLVTASFGRINIITQKMGEDDAAISIIRERLTSGDRTLNLRNLHMFAVLLERLGDNTRYYYKELDKYENKLDTVKKDIRYLRKDTVMRSVFRDSLLRATYKPQLQQLKVKWKLADSVIKATTAVIVHLKAQASSHAINIEELQYEADAQLKAVSTKAFTKERRYLWESSSTRRRPALAGGFKRSIAAESDIASYYFSNTRGQRYLLIFIGLVFFFWIAFNFRSMKTRQMMSALDSFHFKYIHPLPVTAALVFMLCLAPLFDLNAPAIYVESIGLALMLTLTVFFWARLDRKIFYLWACFVILFLLLSFSRLLGLPFYLQRYWTMLINSAAFLLGLFTIARFRSKYQEYRVMGAAVWIYVLFNFLAIICNLSGRVTFMQLFGATANYAFVQTAALILFIQSVTEASILQIQSSRIRRGYPPYFDSDNIRKGIKQFVTLLAIIIWLVVFTTSLNVYTTLSDYIIGFLTAVRSIGNFSFTLSGLILFLGIIWAANFLQKYIAYFFGDTGDEAAFDNKSQRSRLLITRLILLTAGFLIAVAASGLAIDKITVILGALSVGIGLGLQGIVNNFVSGIILIFDRPLRIGDVVEIGDKKGRVKEIGVRSSTLLTPDGAEVIIPNGDVLSHNIVNWTLSNNNIRLNCSFKIEKPFNGAEKRAGIQELVDAIPLKPPGKEAEIFLQSGNTTSAEIKIFFWCNDVAKSENIRNQLCDKVEHFLEEKGVNIL